MLPDFESHGSAQIFEALARQFADADAPEALRKRVLAMAGEERRHGVLCGAVVEALGGEARWTRAPGLPMPDHADVCRNEALLRNGLSVCCLSETVAVALISAEREQMPDGPLRTLLTEILADEVGHARLGWRWLAAGAGPLDAATRERIGAYLRVAFAHLEAHELAHLPVAIPVPPGGAALGVCDAQDARALFYETVPQVIVPRLEAHGLPARDAWSHRCTPSRNGAGSTAREYATAS